MRVPEAEGRLLEMLGAAGLDPRRLDPLAAWSVFQEFANERVEGVGPNSDDDMLLFECGVYDWSDGKGPRFNWGFVRQFTLYDADGEYDHMEQLHLKLFFPVSPALEAIEVPGIWSGRERAAWARDVESDEGFRAVTELQPLESQVEQWEV
jgi:hypothetical protein